MNNPKQQQPNPPRSIFATFQQLFLPGRDPSYEYWFLGAITLMAAVIRLWRISQPIAYDEAYTFIYYATRDIKNILADYSAPNNHIFHTLLVRIAYDEAYTFVYYAARDFKHILADYSAPTNHIFHTILVRIFYEIFGRQAWVKAA